MPEILTESFCERCGTRYTFESVAPRKTRRLGQFKTLSRGVKNWVMSDDSSLDEALAEARSDDEREVTAQQLDAFHSTFNFCMSCRQYTCGNCWNGAEGHCLSCAPNLGQEILQAPFPDGQVFEPVRLDAEAWPEVDLTAAAAAAANGDALGLDGFPTNGVAHDANGYHADGNGVSHEPDEEFDAVARLAFLSGEVDAPAAAPDAALVGAEPDIEVPPTGELEPAVADLATNLAVAAAIDAAEPGPEDQPVIAETLDAVPDAEPQPTGIDLVDVVKRVAAAGLVAAAADGNTVEEQARTGQARTSDLLVRFRPGQNIDAELAAFEAEQEEAARREGETAALAAAALVAAETPAPAAGPEPETAAVEVTDAALAEEDHRLAEAALAAAAVHHVVEPEPAPIVEPVVERQVVEPEVAQPEPIAAEAPVAEPIAAELEPEPIAARTDAVEHAPAPVDPSPVPAPVREDVVPQPTWQIFAPDQAVGPNGQPAAPSQPVQPVLPAAASAAGSEPQWPVRPEMEDSPSMALLANGSRRTSDAMWAASAREVLAIPAPGAAPVAGVQPCSSCGLSLSANARFCRRCGTRQG